MKIVYTLFVASLVRGEFDESALLQSNLVATKHSIVSSEVVIVKDAADTHTADAARPRPRPPCKYFDCGEGWIKTNTGVCHISGCTNQQCCEEEASCADFTCHRGFLKTSSAACGATSCQPTQCCAPEDTCANFECDDGHVKTSSGGCNALKCKHDTCCDQEATCSAHRCGAGLVSKSVEEDGCDATTCSDEQCCEEEDSCDVFKCGVGFVKISNEPCGTNACERSQCCTKEAVCANFGCDEGFIKTSFGPCGGPACLPDQCCSEEATCANYVCDEGFIKTSDAACGSVECKNSQCCEEEASCSDFTCSRGFLKISSTACGATSCQATQCCAPEDTCANFKCDDGHVKTSSGGCNALICKHDTCCDQEATCSAHRCGSGLVNKVSKNCELPKDAKVCNIWGDPFITHAFDGGNYKNVNRMAIHDDIMSDRAMRKAGEFEALKGFEFQDSGVFWLGRQGSDFEAQAFMCSGPEFPEDTSGWGSHFGNETVWPLSSINGVAVKMETNTIQILRNPKTKGSFQGDIHDEKFWNNLDGVPRAELQEIYINGQKTSWHTIGTGGATHGASGTDVPQTARGDFIGDSRNYISQFHSPNRQAANITATPVCVGSADKKFLIEIGVPVTNSAAFEQQVTFFATNPDAAGVCGDPSIREGMDEFWGVRKEGKLKSLTVSPNKMLFTATQLADLCHVCNMPMQNGICSGSHLNKYTDHHYDFCTSTSYSHDRAKESCQKYTDMWKAVCIVEQCISHGKSARLMDMEIAVEDFLENKKTGKPRPVADKPDSICTQLEDGGTWNNADLLSMYSCLAENCVDQTGLWDGVTCEEALRGELTCSHPADLSGHDSSQQITKFTGTVADACPRSCKQECRKTSQWHEEDGCDAISCSDEQCCEEEESCDEFKCGAGFVKILNAGGLFNGCGANACEHSQCCTEEAVCTNFGCDEGFIKTSFGPCGGPHCLPDQCCTAEATCATFHCGNGWIKAYSGGCGSTECAKAVCCDESSTVVLGMCTLSGDPHIKTFDRLRRDRHFYDYGDYWLVERGDIWVQARYWGGLYSEGRSVSKSVVRMVAISEPRVGGSTVIVSSKGMLVDGEPMPLNTDWKTALISHTSSGRYHTFSFTFAPLTTIKVTLSENELISTLSVILTMPRPTREQSGHCGNFNGDAADDDIVSTEMVSQSHLILPPHTWEIDEARHPGVAKCAEGTKKTAMAFCSEAHHRVNDYDPVDITDCVVDYCSAGKAAAAASADFDAKAKETQAAMG